MAVYIECKQCGYKEKCNKELFFKIIGGALAGFGPAAWLGYLFAGTGFALPICAAILAGGIAMLAFADQITKWLSSKYNCPKCNNKSWKMVKD